MKAVYDWKKVDWKEQDITISRNLGCSRERVRQKRNELCKSRSEFYHRKNSSLVSDIAKYNTSDKTLKELAIIFDCNIGYLRGILRSLGKDYSWVDKRKGGKYAWDTADWGKTDRQVAAFLGVPNAATVTQHRRRMGIIKHRSHTIAPSKERTEDKVVWISEDVH